VRAGWWSKKLGFGALALMPVRRRRRNPPDIKFTVADRPRTGKSVDVCTKCEANMAVKRSQIQQPTSRRIVTASEV
jgi:hypothetical protein